MVYLICMLWQWIDQRHNCGEILSTTRVKADINIEKNKQKRSNNDEMRHSQSVINDLTSLLS